MEPLRELVLGFGVEPIQVLNYDPYAGHGIYIGDDPRRQSEVQRRHLMFQAVKRVEQDTGRPLEGHDLSTQAGVEAAYVEVKRIIHTTLGGMRSSGCQVPEYDPDTGESVPPDTLRQLELAHEMYTVSQRLVDISTTFDTSIYQGRCFNAHTGQPIDDQDILGRARTQLHLLTRDAAANTGRRLSRLGLKIDAKFNPYAAHRQKIESDSDRLDYYRSLINSELELMSVSGILIPHYDQQSGESLAGNSLRQLESSQLAASRKLYPDLDRFYREQIRIFQERRRLQPPIAEGEIFDPKQELASLRHQGKDAVEQYKAKLAYQQEGWAYLQEDLYQQLVFSGRLYHDRVKNTVMGYAHRYGFSPEAQRQAIAMARAMDDARRRAIDAINGFPDPRQFCQHFFDTDPLGPVDIALGPLSIDLDCHGDGKLYESLTHMPQSAAVFMSPIFESQGIAITITLGGNGREQRLDLAHEQRHAADWVTFNQFVAKAQLGYNLSDILTQSDPRLRQQQIRDYFSLRDQSSLLSMRSELLAFLVSGWSDEDILRYLRDKQGGTYDYSRSYRQYICDRDYPNSQIEGEVVEAMTNIFVKQHRRYVEQGSISLRRLQRAGYTKPEIIGLLSTEPLPRWPKIVKRLTEKNG